MDLGLLVSALEVRRQLPAGHVEEIVQRGNGLHQPGDEVGRGGLAVGAGAEGIHGRIDKIYCDASDKNIDEIRQIFRGELVEGMDYAKPGGEREDEPDDYDPLNIIIQEGNAYCLSDKTKQKPNGAMYNPCELCALRHECDETGTNSPCELLYARNNQYMREVGRAKYDRHSGTISVTDEMKELEIENRKLEEELKRDGK